MIQYKQEYGNVYFHDGFEEELKGKTVEEQLRCYCWVYGISSHSESWGYYEYDYKTMPGHIRAYCSFDRVTGYIPVVRDGLVVGVAELRYRTGQTGEQEAYYKVQLPYESVCYDYSEEENGSGYKTTYRNRYLVCLPFEHDLW